MLNLHKPVCITSRDAVNRVQRIIRSVKVGHAGTLDPAASGVLVLCLGKATRLISYVQDRPKRYVGTFELGKVSTTDDREGEITETGQLSNISREDLEHILPQFVGDIEQVPPVFSAVHVKGKRAYELARKGTEVELEPRTVHIETLEITDWSFPRFSLAIECGSGTYIRSLGRDIGQTLGCGAYMTDLIRTAVGEFTLENALDLDDLSRELIEKNLIPAGEAVRHLPRATCHDSQQTNILNGKQFEPISANDSVSGAEDKSLVAVYDEVDDLVCLAEPVSGTN
ncbi:MAG: tRNA pseudouridine(55) synthase TruB, partial [Planctomycetes bacterium]|nr:tRNA pseudouridine(55) synthase TruB [Planctomycetota bacterium]